MKLSAPPPPPPPSPDPPPAPGEQPDPNSPANAPAPEVPSEAAPTPPAPEAKPLRWPTWYSGADALLVALVLVFTFAAASFVARNSDVWLHLAAGQRLFAGQYFPGGSDPFSYSAADRAWVNHSWLFDAGAYLLYGGNGVLLGVVKALILTGAFALLIAIRRPQFPLWPWAVCACVAVLAAAPQFQLRSFVMSVLFLSVTMYLLFRMPQKPGSWQFPIAIGVTFWLWANCDRWFFVGPLALALVLVGDLIQTKLFASPDEPADGADEPLGRLPDTAALAKALGIGVLACMLNPHHVRVWELPVEVTKPAVLEGEPRLRQLLIATYQEAYRDSTGYGNNRNGLAYAVLFLAGAAALGFGPGRIRVAHVALWLGFAALSLWTVYAIPLFAVVAVPVLAAQLNAISQSARAQLKTWGDPTTRMLLIGSSVGRIGCVLGAVALCVIAYPGWAHPDTSNPAYARRVAWGVEPEPALEQAARQFKAWRESGQLPADARGFVAHTELANYLAWFAPQEKVFVNGRYGHHLAELPDYVAVRRGLRLVPAKDDLQARSFEAMRVEATDVLRRHKAEYVALYAGPADGMNAVNLTNLVTALLLREPGEWSPWYTDGRTTVFGWRPAGTPGTPAFAALRVDVVGLAFGPDVTPAADVPPQPPLAELSWEEAFVRPPKPGPVAAAEALGWLQFKDAPKERQRNRQILREGLMGPLFFAAPAVAGTAHGLAIQVAGGRGDVPIPPTAATDAGPTGLDADATAIRAAPLLALRAARRAIAKDPDHPDGYWALFRVLSDPDLVMSEPERVLGRVAALRQCLTRMPKPDRYRRNQFLAPASDVAKLLAGAYLGEPIPGPRDRTGNPTVRGFTGMRVELPPLNILVGQSIAVGQSGQLVREPFAVAQSGGGRPGLRLISGPTPYFLAVDLALDALKLAGEYQPIDSAGEPPEEAKKYAAQLEMFRRQVESAVVQANEQYGPGKAGTNLPERVTSALFSGLAGEAYELLTRNPDETERAYEKNVAHAAVQRVALEVATGQVENAHDTLTRLEGSAWPAALEAARMVPTVRRLRYQKAMLAGEYKLAGEVMGAGEGQQIGVEAVLAEVAKAKVSPRDLLYTMAVGWPPVELNRMWGPAAFQIAVMERAGGALQARAAIANKLESDAHYFHQRGVLALLEGDVRSARQWFQQARRQPPPGWELGEVVLPDASRFLKLIERAEQKPAKP